MLGPLNTLSIDVKTKITYSEATGGSKGVAHVSGSLTTETQTINIVGTVIQNSYAKTGTEGVFKVIGKDAIINVLSSAKITNSEATNSHGGVIHFANNIQA